MEPFQGNEGLTFIEHMKAGFTELNKDLENSLLIFSGHVSHHTYIYLPEADFFSGATKLETPKSEAFSYYELAIHKGFITPVNVRSVITEEFACDSYENILFSIARYYQYTCRWPTHITVISHAFKEKRITELHFASIKWPASASYYIGIYVKF